jgi:hypothetical protein
MHFYLQYHSASVIRIRQLYLPNIHSITLIKENLVCELNLDGVGGEVVNHPREKTNIAKTTQKVEGIRFCFHLLHQLWF